MTLTNQGSASPAFTDARFTLDPVFPARLIMPAAATIPAGTIIPKELVITKDHYIPKKNSWHYSISPNFDMPVSKFLRSLDQLAINAEIKNKGVSNAYSLFSICCGLHSGAGRRDSLL
ncbi:hypothetical protein [Rheinheimera baltica]|uniref:Tse2 family ADP-ribosyltransferase toxin n=1 Tax=Rheinheimera baltica TaxID=67576 RepID=UPI00273E2778|nr:hypothetical protein [Rheinheimera baltica]MDP5189076.1 hypothetical protein [Rheinheimera baltica]